MKNLIKLLNIIDDEISICKDSHKQELLRKRSIIETMIYLMIKNDQK